MLASLYMVAIFQEDEKADALQDMYVAELRGDKGPSSEVEKAQDL